MGSEKLGGCFCRKAFDEYRGQQLKPPRDINIDDDDELDAWIRQTGETLYHPVGTRKMGRDEMRRVVDAQGSVHGLLGAEGGRCLANANADCGHDSMHRQLCWQRRFPMLSWVTTRWHPRR